MSDLDKVMRTLLSAVEKQNEALRLLTEEFTELEAKCETNFEVLNKVSEGLIHAGKQNHMRIKLIEDFFKKNNLFKDWDTYHWVN